MRLGPVPLAFLRLPSQPRRSRVVALASVRLHAPSPRPASPCSDRARDRSGCALVLFFEAVKRGSVALAVITFSAAPIFLAVLAPLFLPERLSNVALGALVPGGIGIALVALAGDDGEAFGWVAARLRDRLGARRSRCCSSSRSGFSTRRVPPLTVAFWDCLGGGAVIAPALLLVGGVLPADAGEWGAVLLLGVGFTGLATLLYAGFCAT